MGLFQKQSEVASQVRLTFSRVDDDIFGFFAFGNHHLDMGGEGGAAHADDTAFLDFIDDLFGVQLNVGEQLIGDEDTLGPFVLLFTVDENGGLVVTRVVHHHVDFSDDAGGRGVDVGRDEALGRANELTRQHAFTFVDDAFSRCAEALSERDDDLLGHREVLYGLVCRDFVLFGMHAALFESLYRVHAVTVFSGLTSVFTSTGLASG